MKGSATAQLSTFVPTSMFQFVIGAEAQGLRARLLTSPRCRSAAIYPAAMRLGGSVSGTASFRGWLRHSGGPPTPAASTKQNLKAEKTSGRREKALERRLRSSVWLLTLLSQLVRVSVVLLVCCWLAPTRHDSRCVSTCETVGIRCASLCLNGLVQFECFGFRPSSGVGATIIRTIRRIRTAPRSSRSPGHPPPSQLKIRRPNPKRQAPSGSSTASTNCTRPYPRSLAAYAGPTHGPLRRWRPAQASHRPDSRKWPPRNRRRRPLSIK